MNESEKFVVFIPMGGFIIVLLAWKGPFGLIMCSKKVNGTTNLTNIRSLLLPFKTNYYQPRRVEVESRGTKKE